MDDLDAPPSASDSGVIGEQRAGNSRLEREGSSKKTSSMSDVMTDIGQRNPKHLGGGMNPMIIPALFLQNENQLEREQRINSQLSKKVERLTEELGEKNTQLAVLRVKMEAYSSKQIIAQTLLSIGAILISLGISVSATKQIQVEIPLVAIGSLLALLGWLYPHVGNGKKSHE